MRNVIKRLRVVGLVAIFGLQLLASLSSAASAEEIKKLSINQIKITSDNQFVTIYNPNNKFTDLSKYELIYLNTDNKPTKTFTFSGELSPNGYFILNDGQLNACHLMTVESVTMSFSTTGGSVQLWHYEDEFTKVLDDSVSWVKTKKSTTPANTLTLPTDENEFLNRTINEDEEVEWLVVKPSPDNSCQLETVKQAEEESAEVINFSLLPGTMPPVRYVSAVNAQSSLVNRNIGKMAPIVNELLPNPASPQKDADDEFIELYNPNNTSFDLTDFQLAFGSDNPKKYTFKEGTKLAAKEFKAFTSKDTSISLANSIAQVWLLDPTGKVVGSSEPYEDAKDGQAWALNNGTWQWSSAPSPNQSNTLTEATSTDKKDTGAATVLGITTGGSNTPGATLASATTSPSQLGDAVPLHPLVLAGVGLLAVAYALYEYRNDIGNNIHKFRRYLEARRATR